MFHDMPPYQRGPYFSNYPLHSWKSGGLSCRNAFLLRMGDPSLFARKSFIFAMQRLEDMRVRAKKCGWLRENGVNVAASGTEA